MNERFESLGVLIGRIIGITVVVAGLGALLPLAAAWVYLDEQYKLEQSWVTIKAVVYRLRRKIDTYVATCTEKWGK